MDLKSKQKIEEIQNEIRKKWKQIYKIEDEISTCYRIIEKEENRRIINKNYSIIDALNQLKFVLKNQSETLYDQMQIKRMEDWNLIGNNEQIDLYKIFNGIDGKYFIYLHSSTTEIGLIEYNPCIGSIYGDISYDIDTEYQGNNYAYQALMILLNHLSQNDIYRFRISAKENNKASIRTIEKMLNQALEFQKNIQDDIIIYDVILKSKKIKK